jgi:AcrR family transcriptional regulator
MARRGRGRPTGESGTREAIIEAARRQFGDLGYRRTTLRSVAAGAGVDARLVLHYFGSKQNLFLESVELPLDPQRVIELVFSRGIESVGRSAAEIMVGVLDEPRSRQALTGLLRAAVSEPEAAELIRRLLAERILTPIAQRVGGEQPELRASLVGSQLVGLATARHLVGLPSLLAATREQLIAALAPVIDHYLRGDWLAAG